MAKDDIETLKAWCHWKRAEYGRNAPDEDELAFVAAIENVISQVGTWKAKYEKLHEAQFPKVTQGHTGPCAPGCTCTASWSARNVEHTIPHGEYGTCSACESTQDDTCGRCGQPKHDGGCFT